MTTYVSPVLLALEDAAGAPLTLAEIVKRAGLSRARTEKWLRRLRADGLAWSEALRGGRRGRPKLVWRRGRAPEQLPLIPGGAS